MVALLVSRMAETFEQAWADLRTVGLFSYTRTWRTDIMVSRSLHCNPIFPHRRRACLILCPVEHKVQFEVVLNEMHLCGSAARAQTRSESMLRSSWHVVRVQTDTGPRLKHNRVSVGAISRKSLPRNCAVAVMGTWNSHLSVCRASSPVLGARSLVGFSK